MTWMMIFRTSVVGLAIAAVGCAIFGWGLWPSMIDKRAAVGLPNGLREYGCMWLSRVLAIMAFGLLTFLFIRNF